MKKFAIITAMAAALIGTNSFAQEATPDAWTQMGSLKGLVVGVRGTHSSGADLSLVGATVGRKFGKFGAEISFDRSTRGTENLNRWSLVGSYDMAKFGPVSVAAKAGVASMDPARARSGGAVLAGLGASYPLTKNVALVGDYYYQKGADRISATDGNYFSFGAKYTF